MCLTQDQDADDRDVHSGAAAGDDDGDERSRPVPWVRAGGGVVLRVRAVENPVYLRVRAVSNLVRGCCVVGGGGGLKEGTLGAGKERVLRIAFEGIGRSWLGVEGPSDHGREGGRQWC